MKKQIVSVVMAAAAAGTLLAGCGNSSGTAATSTAASQASDTQVSAAETASTAETATASLDALPATQMDGTVKATPEMYPGVDMSDPYTVKM